MFCPSFILTVFEEEADADLGVWNSEQLQRARNMSYTVVDTLEHQGYQYSDDLQLNIFIQYNARCCLLYATCNSPQSRFSLLQNHVAAWPKGATEGYTGSENIIASADQRAVKA